MDKRSVQYGGGQRVLGQKYFVPYNKHPRYRLCSGNLELVTIVECIVIDGKYLSPGVIFEGKE